MGDPKDAWFGKAPAVMETGYSSWNRVLATEAMQARWCNESIAALRSAFQEHARAQGQSPTRGHGHSDIDTGTGTGTAWPGQRGGAQSNIFINFYQLVDEGGPASRGRAGLSGPSLPEEAAFGVVRRNTSRKPAFAVLARAIATFAGTGPPALDDSENQPAP